VGDATRRSLAVALGVAFSVAFSEPEASASPEDLFGYGARTSAMGATGAAHAGGAETAFHNPALASTLRETTLSLGYGGATFALDAASGSVAGRVPTQPAKGIYAGVAVPMPFGGWLRDRVGFASAFYTPTDVVLRARVLYPETPQFPILGNRAQSLMVRGGVGVDVGHGVRVGIGAAALAELVGGVTTTADAAGNVGTRVDEQLVATYAPTVGVAWDAWERAGSTLRVGATFRGTLDARFSVLVDARKLSSLPIPLLDIAGTAQYDPAQLALEVARLEPLAVRAVPFRTSTVLAAQVVYKRWRDFSGFLAPTVSCSEGGVGACGLLPPAIDWRDTVAVRIGAEESIELAPGVLLSGRSGAFFETSPLPSDVPGADAFDPRSGNVVHVSTQYFDAFRFAITTGAGLSLSDPLPAIALDFFVQYHVLLDRTVTSGDVATDVSGHVKVFGLTGSVRF
jgi:long-chain fatty acid transport protein